MGNVHRDVQKDMRNMINRMPSPGSANIEEITKYGTKPVQDKAQDERVTPKPGIRKNKLVAKYGTNFRYLGIVKNGLDRVMVVKSILIPRFENIKVKPINFAKCAKTLDGDNKDGKYLITADTQASKAAERMVCKSHTLH